MPKNLRKHRPYVCVIASNASPCIAAAIPAAANAVTVCLSTAASSALERAPQLSAPAPAQPLLLPLELQQMPSLRV
jgi:hypothetical protein